MNSIARFRQFVEDVVKELKRTTWPSKPEVLGTTLVVIVAVLIISAFLGVVDLVLATLQKQVMNFF